MKNIKNLIWVVAIVSPALTMAQPPEVELSPTAPEFNIEVMDAPVPTEATVADPVAPSANAQVIQPILPAIPAQIPVAAPITESPAAVKEDKSVKGITLSPSVTLKPLGYNADRAQSFFEISPSAGIASTFKTANGRDVGLNVSYGFIWDEFLSNRAAALRYFEHDLSGSADISWTNNFSTSVAGGFNYSLWASDNREHAVFSDDSITGTLKINDQVSVTSGYHLFFYNDLDSQFHLSDGTYPSDGDDIRQGNSALSGSDQFYTDPNSSTFNYDPATGSVWFTNNGAVLKTKYKPTAKTSLGVNYEYVFATFTNTDATNWRGHFIVASISQGMPWKGGTVTLTDQVRLRNYESKTNPDGSFASNARNRLTLSVGQAVTDTIAAELWYRWEMNGSNADNYAVMKNSHYINLGFTFSF